MELTDILSTEGWKQLAEEIYEKFGLNGLVNDKDGSLIAASSRWANKICPKIKGGEQSRTICAIAYQYLVKLAQEKKEPAVGECDVGLTKILVPIFYKEEFLGSAGGCGLLAEDGEIDTFYIAKVLSLNEEEVEKWMAGVKQVSQTEIETVVGYVKKRLDEILQTYKSKKFS
jgi:ligand-binding sensor protein